MSDYQFIRLSEWAAMTFPNEHYSPTTMMQWAKTQQIQPPPIKVGGRWMVKKDARFVGLDHSVIPASTDPLVDRILRNGR